MQGNNLKDQDATHQDATNKLNRRKFLTRTSVGLVVASLPAKSVWASSNGLAQSIVASGQGSEFTNSKPIKLKSSGFWGNPGKGSIGNKLPEMSRLFHSVFPGKALALSASQLKKNKIDIHKITLGDAAQVNGVCQGAGKENRFITAIYLNAVYHGQYNIHFPIIGSSPTFSTLEDLAKYLYGKASIHGGAFAAELEQLINKNPA